jgi:hypothetical protein
VYYIRNDGRYYARVYRAPLGMTMKLRSELMPPALSKERVTRLAKLAARIDGAAPGQWEEALAEFNREACTTFEFRDFQGIYGGQDHDTWVRSVLAESHQKVVPDITKTELVELARRVMEVDGKENEIDYWLELLAANIPDPRISDLIFWPGEYFADGDNSREFTPEQVIDTAVRRAGRLQDSE